MAALATLTYGVVAYVVFLATFLYLIGFVGDFVVLKSINDGPPTPAALAIIIDLVLVGLFGLQHSIMARPGFKRWWTRTVPEPIERSTFVLSTCVVLVLLYWQWRPLPATLWDVEGGVVAGILWGLFALGWALVLVATFVIDHFDLFGLRQVYLFATGNTYTHPKFKERMLYKMVRHPLMLGFLIAFWAAPHMTAGRALFAVAMTLYILVAIQVEERDLVAFHGDDYRQYQERVSMLLPIRRRPRG